MRNFSEEIFRENQNQCFMLNNLFPFEKRVVYEMKVEKLCTAK
jgi:hypothetical protein